MNAIKRLRKEAQAPNDNYIKLIVNPENPYKWKALLKAPQDSVYEGFIFLLNISVPEAYPLVPPAITFSTRIFHPNVLFGTGEICLDILKKEWSPAWSLQSAVRAISSLMADPAADSPLNCDAGNMVRAGDMAAFRSTARYYCVEYAEESQAFDKDFSWSD